MFIKVIVIYLLVIVNSFGFSFAYDNMFNKNYDENFLLVDKNFIKSSKLKGPTHYLTTKSGEHIACNQFFSNIFYIAKDIERFYGIPANVTLAMAAYESNHGRSYLARKGFNFFGIKAFNDWKGKKILNPKDGLYYRKYDSIEDGIWGYAEFLSKNRYKEAFNYKHDSKIFIQKILQCGYCPDSFYLKDISMIFKKHRLDSI